MGITSPSLVMVDSKDEVFDYTIASLKYLCYKRRLKKYQYKSLYREVRRERKNKEIFNNYYNELK